MASSGSYDKHRELVKIGAEWLASEKSGDYRCQFVVTEFSNSWSDRRIEIPDVFGAFVFGSTCLIECKCTRSDFRQDRKKDFRHNGSGVGNYRFYLCPPTIIRKEELPTRWGLLYLGDDGNISVIRDPVRFDTKGCTMDERDILFDLTMTLYNTLESKFIKEVVAADIDKNLDERDSAVSFRIWMGSDQPSSGSVDSSAFDGELGSDDFDFED